MQAAGAVITEDMTRIDIPALDLCTETECRLLVIAGKMIILRWAALADLITNNERQLIQRGIGITTRKGFTQCKGTSNLGTRWTLALPVEARASHTRMTPATTARLNGRHQFNQFKNPIWESSMGLTALVGDPNTRALSYRNSEIEMEMVDP